MLPQPHCSTRSDRRTLIEVLAETGSTNADLAARLTGGEAIPEGFWLVADRQTSGRGRQGRAWFDGHGNFMGSTFVADRFGDPPLPTLALVAGLAVCEALGNRVPPPARATLKWPNDIMIGVAKLAGILLERAAHGVVIGVGVNLAVAPQVDGRQTVALAAFGPAPDRDMFAADLAACLARELDRWRGYGLGPVVARWLAAAHPVGTPLLVGEPDQMPVRGEFAGLDDSGALLLRRGDGTTQTVHAGEVRLADQS